MDSIGHIPDLLQPGTFDCSLGRSAQRVDMLLATSVFGTPTSNFRLLTYLGGLLVPRNDYYEINANDLQLPTSNFGLPTSNF